MKKNIFTKLAIFSLAATLFSCSSDENLGDNNGTKKVIFKATTEISQKTVIDSNDPTVINWENGDAINITMAHTENTYRTNHKFVTNDSGNSHANFEYEPYTPGETWDINPSATYCATYPYIGANLGYDNNNDYYYIDYNNGLPNIQTAVSGSFDKSAAFMAAVTTGNNSLAFKNLVSYIKVTPKMDCNQIVLTAHNDVKIAGGMVRIKFTIGNTTPEFQLTGSGKNEIILTGTITANSAYYIALAPTTLTDGFELSFRATDGKIYNKSTSKQVVLSRNTVLNVGEIGPTNSTLTYDPSLIPTNYEYVDLGLPSGTLWAKCNIGAATPEENGYYFAWGETSPKAEYTEANYSSILKSKYTNEGDELAPEDDAAYMNWGSDWRTPSKADWRELKENTTITAIRVSATDKTILGYQLTSKVNGETLYFPKAGYKDGSTIYTSDPYVMSRTSYGTNAYDVQFEASVLRLDQSVSKHRGTPVRPVKYTK